MRDEVLKLIEIRQAKQNAYENQKRRVLRIKIGDLVLVKAKSQPVGLSKKLFSPFRGPFIVKEQLTPVTFKVTRVETPNGREFTVNAERIRPLASTDDIPSGPTVVVEDEETNEEIIGTENPREALVELSQGTISDQDELVDELTPMEADGLSNANLDSLQKDHVDNPRSIQERDLQEAEVPDTVSEGDSVAGGEQETADSSEPDLGIGGAADAQPGQQQYVTRSGRRATKVKPFQVPQ
ncbi:hypothetical protein HDE_11695 [Halotydeus destructor]|nr:hypothetical protein HDE_11695 [Halotydeus destructor]